MSTTTITTTLVSCWIYKWDYSSPGVFYALDRTGNVLKGHVNLSPETKASNWLVLLVDDPTKMKIPSYMNLQVDETHVEWGWWCSEENYTPQDIIDERQVCYGVRVFLPDMNIPRTARIIECNKKQFGVRGVAAVKTDKDEAVLTQYFLRCKRRNSEFCPFGWFTVKQSSWRCSRSNDLPTIYIDSPLEDVSFVSVDFRHRPDFLVMSYDVVPRADDACTDDRHAESAFSTTGLSPKEAVVCLSAAVARFDGKTGLAKKEKKREKKEEDDDDDGGDDKFLSTRVWLLVPERKATTATFEPADVKMFSSEKSLLEDFLAFAFPFPCLFGYNNKSVDDNFLLTRCMYHGIPLPSMDKKRDEADFRFFFKNWIEGKHRDAVEFLARSHQNEIDLLDFYENYHSGVELPSLRLSDVAASVLIHGTTSTSTTTAAARLDDAAEPDVKEEIGRAHV